MNSSRLFAAMAMYCGLFGFQSAKADQLYFRANKDMVVAPGQTKIFVALGESKVSGKTFVCNFVFPSKTFPRQIWKGDAYKMTQNPTTKIIAFSLEELKLQIKEMSGGSVSVPKEIDTFEKLSEWALKISGGGVQISQKVMRSDYLLKDSDGGDSKKLLCDTDIGSSIPGIEEVIEAINTPDNSFMVEVIF